MGQLEMKKLPTKVKIFLRLLTFSDAQLNLVDIFTDAILQYHVNTDDSQPEYDSKKAKG
jgi:hypothetical protein